MSKEILEQLTKLGSRVDELSTQVVTATAGRRTGAEPGVPFARKGENVLSSRGLMFSKILALKGDHIAPEDAKIELMVNEKLTKACLNAGYQRLGTKSIMLPLWPEAFNREQLGAEDYEEINGLLQAGTKGYDPNEAAWWRQKAAASAASPAQSWVDQSLGGSFVPPPTFGPPIELLRNREVMIAAGATVMPLGPSGSLQLPRLLSATTGSWAGENSGQTPITAATGSLTLRGKKVVVFLVMPNELLRFASPAIEGIIRNDMMKTAALVMDKAFLDGQGSDNVPLGIVNTPGIATVTPKNANKLGPEDCYAFRSAIEANNGEPNAFVMRPELFWKFPAARWTPYSGAGAVGGFTYDPMRPLGQDYDKVLAGLKVVTSPQVSQTRGSGAQTYCLCGDFTDFIVGLFGAIEFASTDQGFNLFGSDQTAVRAIVTCDGGAKHAGVFAIADALGISVTDS